MSQKEQKCIPSKSASPIPIMMMDSGSEEAWKKYTVTVNAAFFSDELAGSKR